MPSLYYLVFVVIISLALISLGSLWWVMLLQRRLRALKVKTASLVKPVDSAAHAILTDAERLKLENMAKDDIKMVLTNVAQHFQEDLFSTSKKVNGKIEELTDKVIQDELTKYQNALAEVRQASIETLSRIQSAIEQDSQKNREDVVTAIEIEKKRVIEKFEQKIGDIVAGYLVEVLGSNVDLGAQRGYLFATLESHKDELKKAITDGP